MSETITPAPAVSKLPRAGALIAAGLGIEAATLFPIGPIPFLVFAGLGVSLTLLGIADFLWQILRQQDP